MTRHVLDHVETKEDGSGLKRFLRLARGEHRHNATEELLRRPRSRDPQGGRIAGWLKARNAHQT